MHAKIYHTIGAKLIFGDLYALTIIEYLSYGFLAEGRSNHVHTYILFDIT